MPHLPRVYARASAVAVWPRFPRALPGGDDCIIQAQDHSYLPTLQITHDHNVAAGNRSSEWLGEETWLIRAGKQV